MGDENPFLVDTGSPYTVLDTGFYPDVGKGKHAEDIDAFGLTFPGYQTVTLDLFNDPSDPASALAGILGGDLVRHFAFSIDYRGRRVWLFDPFDEQLAPT